MTVTLVCEWCGVRFDQPNDRGPTPKYCRPSHRQRAFEARHFMPDERAVALVIEWWTHVPVAEFEDGANCPAEVAAMEDAKALFEHLHKHGYTVARIPNGIELS